MRKITVRVPASTSNLGPGFDVLGVALKLYNDVAVGPAERFPDDPFIMEAADLFFKTAKRKARPFSVNIKGEVPQSSGLGSSVTVRLGVLCGLNVLHGSRLKPEKMRDLTVELEKHPDNAVPAFHGGFIAASDTQHFRATVSPQLTFVTAAPCFELKTDGTRDLLPPKIERKEVVANLQNTALITAAFASRNYELLRGCSVDFLHQPHRAKFVPGFYKTVAAAEKAGALSAFLSGAGPSIIAMTLKNAKQIGKVMIRELKKAGNKTVCLKFLKADNRGTVIR